MKYLANSLWMLLEQAMIIISGLFIVVYVARSVGPEKFGMLSYVLAMASFITVFSRLGMESVLVKELTKRRSKSSSYMGTAFYLMLFGGLVSAIIVVSALLFWDQNRSASGYVMIVSLGIMFQSFLVIDYNFQSQVRVKLSSRVKIFSIILTSILKFILAYLNAPLVYFVIVYALDYAIVGILLYATHSLDKQRAFLFHFKTRLVRPLLSSAFPMIMSGVATIAIVKTDQIMIKSMLCDKSLGVYAAASKIYEGWSTLSLVLSLSILPIMVREKNKSQKLYYLRTKIFFSWFFWSSVIFASFGSIFSDFIMSILYGAEYSEGKNVLSIIIWAAPLSAISFVFARYLIIENMQSKIAIRNWVSLGLNIPLNYVFIKIYGIEGAAISTLIILLFAHCIMDCLDKDLRVHAKMKWESIFSISNLKNKE